MSIQPHRVLARIVEQVDRSDWPALRARVLATRDADELLRLYVARSHGRYATPIHFWVHALREDLGARGRRQDLVGAAGHALCRRQPVAQWQRELEDARCDARRDARGEVEEDLAGRLVAGLGPAPQAYRMLESACRRSSVVEGGGWLVAHFWGHGSGESWRRETIR